VVRKLWPGYLNFTDVQIDSLTICHSNTALCVASCGGLYLDDVLLLIDVHSHSQ